MALSGVVAQNLSVKSLELAAMDLTAARQAVTDLNGVPCALLKVQMLDRMVKAEGNIIRRVDNGTETWLYLTEGTKMVKIIGEKHKPLMVNISDWFPKGVERKLTYILELDSDLPPEVLLSTAKQEIQPVAMSAATAPLLPDWWNTAAESDLYVGIAPPTLDGKRAKTMALSNAIGMYANASRQPVSFTGNYKSKIKGDSESEALEIASELPLMMNFDILQEYYNHRGEYFVLCRIRDSEKEGNAKAKIVWNGLCSMAEDKEEHNIKVSLAFMLNEKDAELQGISTYYTDSDLDKGSMISCNGIDFTLPDDFEYTTEKDQSETSLFITTAHSLGAAQTRLLYTLPFVPDSLEISSSTFQDGDNVSSETVCMGYSTMLPHKLVVKGLYQDGLSFSFPTDMNGLKVRTFSDETAKRKWQQKIKKEKKLTKDSEKNFISYRMIYEEKVYGYECVSDLSNVTAGKTKALIAGLGSLEIIRRNHLEVLRDDPFEEPFEKTGFTYGLKNIIWYLDADFAVRRVNIDKKSYQYVTILPGKLD